MALEKAKLLIETDSGEEKKELPVQFNPAEYNLTDAASYSEKGIPGLPGPILQFISGAASTLNLSLTFDTYDTPANGQRPVYTGKSLTEVNPHEPTDVSKLVRQVVALTEIDGTLHRPPKVTFAWGSLRFRGIVTDVKQTYTMFMPNGMPVRARVELSLKAVIDVAQKKKQSPFESPDRTKYRTIHEGENLWNFAAQEYGDPDMWRVIARENGLMNPLDIRPGQVIRLPALKP